MNHLTFRPRKSLGQNFMVDENVAQKIVRILAPNPDDIIIEIGPGFGVLTAYILQRCARVVAVEVDRYLISHLQARFEKFDNFELIAGDFLKTELRAFVPEGGRLRLVGNIPYHITSPVIFKAFAAREVMSDMLLTIQREVAERIVAGPCCKEYGILSVFSQAYAQPQIACYISRNVFKPRPEVDSAVVRWDFSKSADADVKNDALFRQVVRATFNQRRKMLRKSLQQLDKARSILPQLNFDLQKRPEELPVGEFIELTNQIAGAWKKQT